MDTGIPLFFSEIEYLLLETIPLETIMRVVSEVVYIFVCAQLCLWKDGKYRYPGILMNTTSRIQREEILTIFCSLSKMLFHPFI